MPFFENGPVKIHYEETGSGFPLLVLPGGGLNASIARFSDHPFNPLEEFGDTYRVIAVDLRNAIGGQSVGPLEIDRPWDSFTDDHLGLMDHLGIDRFLVMGFCIGGPMIWNILKHASERVISAMMVHPSGYSSYFPNLFRNRAMEVWAPELVNQRSEITMEMASDFLDNLFTKRQDFVFTVDRDFVRNCQTPFLVLPDDIPPHPYATAMETALLAPNAQVSLYPWKDNPKKIALALRHIRGFMKENAPSK